MAVKDNKSPFAIELLELSQEYHSFTEEEIFQSSNEALILDETGEKVLVKITTGRPSGFVPGANLIGFETENNNSQSNHQFIEEFIPIASINTFLETILEDRLLLGVVPVYQPMMTVGSVTSQANFIQEADRVKNSVPSSYNGSGVTVGVLSDSFNSRNGASGDIASGDLPDDITVISRNGITQDISGGSDEGRAMLQLIHDLAPEADLAFATAFTGEYNFAENIRALAQAGADIIVDDVVYLGEPFFQDGIVALAVDEVVEDYGVTYFSSAGNNAAKSYESDDFAGTANTSLDSILEADTTLDAALDRSDANGNEVQGDFTVPEGGYRYHDFDPDPNRTDNRQGISLNNNQMIRLAFQWDDPFYTAGGVDTDLDIFLLDSNDRVVAYSFNDNVGNRTPLEYLNFTNNSGSSQNYDLVIAKYSGSSPERLKYINFGAEINPEYSSFSSTIYGHAAAALAAAVGAVPYFRQTQPESFTSLGPTTFFYEYETDANGNPIAVVRKSEPEVRNKPDIAAIDGTDTTFFGSDIDGNGFPNFFGTSAAAPHAAAIAALLRQAEPGLTPAEIYQRLESTALDLSDPGFDNLTGNGLVNAYNAIFGEAVSKSLIFSDDFEDGDLPLVYQTNSTGGGKIQVTTANEPLGTYQLTLDNSFAGVDSLNELILNLDTTDYSDIQFSFDQKEFDDNDQPMASTFTGSVNADGVALSVDGNTWYRLLSLTGSNSINTYQTHSFNLSDFAEANDLTIGSNLQLKFQQYGLNPIDTANPSFSDGMAIDNILITGTLNGSDENDVITGGIKANSIAGAGGNDRIDGKEGNDTLSGGDDNDLILGKAGNDLLAGDNGDDRLYGDVGEDVIYGGEFNDLLEGGEGNDSLAGGGGRDRLYGENGNDSLVGGTGLDILYGGAGDDSIDGAASGDRLFGNGGADVFVLRAGDGSDLIYDYTDNLDSFGLADSLSFEQLAFTQSGSYAEIKVQSTDELLARLYNVDIAAIDSNDFNLV